MPMQMPDLFSWILFALAIAAILLTDRFPDRIQTQSQFSDRVHHVFCLSVILAGVFVRMVQIAGLPAGPTAEEALVAVQAKSLLQNGGFFGTGAFATQFLQWEGEAAGPLLSILTMPFIALFGMCAVAVRLPLALISCAALPAAYGAGEALAGRRGARWLLIIIAFSPIFIMTSRLTAAASLSLPLLIIALSFALRALKRPVLALAACISFGLLAWTEDLYFILSPVLIAVFSVFLLFCFIRGRNKKNAVCTVGSAVVGLLICLPCILTAYASRANGADLRLGFVLCPHAINRYTENEFLKELLASRHPDLTLITKLWAVLSGGLFQIAMHETISQSYFLPTGMTALFLFSLPFALLGALSCFILFLRRTKNSAASLASLLGAVTVTAEIFFGSKGVLAAGGTTSIWDIMQLFPYTALLILAGILHMERRSRAGRISILTLYGLSFAMLSFWLFSGGYAGEANVSFQDYEAAAKRAGEIRTARSLPVAATSRVHPHKSPEEAARMMILYAMDADMRAVKEDPDAYGEIIWPGSMEEPPEGEICLIAAQDSRGWYWNEEDWDYESFGRYVLLIPK